MTPEESIQAALTVAKWAAGVAALTANGYAEALIEIAAAFDDRGCRHCHSWITDGEQCTDDCPGLLARRALGVA